MTRLVLSQLRKRYGAVEAVRGVTLTVEPGEMFFLLGPSGCGKTTCLRMVAGFETPDEGDILFDERSITRLPPHRREIGMVFQTYALFPHMTVARNVEYGLRFRRVAAPERRARAKEMLETLQLGSLADRFPAQLSGGQQQRVALARALVIRPAAMLLDEPLSNLDTRLRAEVREEIRRIHAAFRTTTLYVTHDQEEALSLADRLAVMRDGNIEQVGAPREVYRRPANSFVATFVGEANLVTGRVGRGEAETAHGPLRFAGELPEGTQRIFAFRPENVALETAAGDGPWTGKVADARYFGGAVRVEVGMPSGETILARIADAQVPAQGAAVRIVVKPDDVVPLER